MQQLYGERLSFWEKSRRSMVVKKAYDCYIEDQKGNKFIDTSMGSGAQIIGHNNPLIRKVGKQIKNGTIYTVPNAHTESVNFYLKKYINPELHDEYIFCNSGTEANMRAVRLARAYTGKNKIARFHGGWHGGIDGFIESKGVPGTTNELIQVLPYNDRSCFDKISTDLAAVIIEPVQGSNPRSDIKSFLKKLREECSKKNVLLIFDEVMTGFRLSLRGGAGLFNIKPDLITYGKVLVGGFPIGALGGAEDIIKTSGVFYGGTFSANPLTMFAAKQILQTAVDEKLIRYNKLRLFGELLRGQLNDWFAGHNLDMHIIGCGPINRIIFTDKFIKNRKERDKFESRNQNEFYKKLKESGVFVNTNGLFHFSMSHETSVVNNIINKIIGVCNE